MSDYDDFVYQDGDAPREEEPAKPVEVKPTQGQLPEDIRKVWGEDPTAVYLIEAWGIERFRQSALHLIAIQELARQQALEPLRKDYLKKKLK